MIRKVRDEDFEDIAKIYNYYVANTTNTLETDDVSPGEMKRRAAMIQEGKYPYIVCEHEGHVVGYAYAHPWKMGVWSFAYRYTFEITLYVDHFHTGHGIGGNLLDALIDHCKRKRVKSLIASITFENERSIKFHERHGFKQASHFKQVGHKFGQFVDVVDVQMQL